jgi:mannose PTS system EIIA component
MLIKLAAVRESSSFEQAVIEAQDADRKYIYIVSQISGAKPEHVRQHGLCHVAK